MCDGRGRPVWLSAGGMDGAEGCGSRGGGSAPRMGNPGGATFAVYHARAREEDDDDEGGFGGPVAIPPFLPPAHLPFPSDSHPSSTPSNSRMLSGRSSVDLLAAKRRRQRAQQGSRGSGRGAAAEAEAEAAGGVLERLLANILPPSTSQPRSLHHLHHHQTQHSWAGAGAAGAGGMASGSRLLTGAGAGAGASPTLALVLPVEVDGECGCTSTGQVALPVAFAPTLQVQMQPPPTPQMQMHPLQAMQAMQATQSAVREWGFPAEAVRSLTWPPKSPSGYSAQTSSWPPLPASPSQINSLLGTSLSGQGSRSQLQPQRSFGAGQGSSRPRQQQLKVEVEVEVWKKPGLSMPPCCKVTRCGGLHRSPDF